jgi:hypothetical protein
MVEANNNIETAHQKLISVNGQDTEAVCDEAKPRISDSSSTNWSTITEDFAKKLGLKLDKSLSNIEASTKAHIANRAVSGIVRQVSDKKIQISIHQLLEIVKPEIRQEIINAIANPGISRKNCIPCKAPPSRSLNSKPDYSHCDNLFSGIYSQSEGTNVPKPTMNEQSEMNCREKNQFLTILHPNLHPHLHPHLGLTPNGLMIIKILL